MKARDQFVRFKKLISLLTMPQDQTVWAVPFINREWPATFYGGSLSSINSEDRWWTASLNLTVLPCSVVYSHSRHSASFYTLCLVTPPKVYFHSSFSEVHTLEIKKKEKKSSCLKWSCHQRINGWRAVKRARLSFLLNTSVHQQLRQWESAQNLVTELPLRPETQTSL